METTKELGEGKPKKIPKTMGDSSPSSSASHGSSASSSDQSKITCPICVCPIRSGIFTAGCSHSFHINCINSHMLHGNMMCPLCRSELKQTPDNTVSPLSFGDDEETLPQPIQSRDSHPHEALSIKLFPQVSAAAKPMSRPNFAALVQLKAAVVSDGKRGAPLDLVIVLDVSGSMEGEKLELMKNAMYVVIQRLGETDRLSVISFSSAACRLFPLILMSESGKKVAIEAVQSLVSGGGTNIAEGLMIGAKVIEDRQWKNPVSGMMLLSDGQDNFTFAYGGVRLRTDYESLLPISSRTPIHTFGLGSDHDDLLMYTISQVSSGTFSFIETEISIKDAFEKCIESLLSVVIAEQLVEIECIHEQGLKISSIDAGSYRSSIAFDARSATVSVVDMYADETLDFLVFLEIPSCNDGSAEPESMPLLKVRCGYMDTVTNEKLCVESEELSIQRPMVLTGKETVSIEVDRQINRCVVSKAMSDARVLADEGKMSLGVALLSNCDKGLSKTVSGRSGDSLCVSLSYELIMLQQRLVKWAIYDRTGRAFLFSCLSSYSTQRATALGNSTHSYSLVQAYKRPQMARVVSRLAKLELGTANEPDLLSASDIV